MESNEDRKIKEEMLTMLTTLGDGAMVPRVATDEDIAQCNASLESLGLPVLPEDYVSFLQTICNGLAWNGIEIYGTGVVSEPAGSAGYQLMDIVTKTDEGDYHYWERLEVDCIYFGRSDEEVFTYNTETKKYEARDLSYIPDVYEEHDTIYAFIKAVVGGRLGNGEEELDDDGRYDAWA
jgi:hypothetical protein